MRTRQQKLATGTLLTLDNLIDIGTGTIRIKAMFDNEDLSLFPNQFVNAKLIVDTLSNVTLIPTVAIQRNPQGAFVYVVTHQEMTLTNQTGTVTTNVPVVAMRDITTASPMPIPAPLRDVEPGEVIVTDNFNKLGDGMRVNVRSAGGGARAQRWRPAATKSAAGARTELRKTHRESVRPFILRPVATSLLMAAIMLVGLVAYQQLPVSALPEVDFPTIQIVTFYPGASPDVMASAVTAPLERQFGQVPGLNQMTSISSGGSSVITLQFALYLNIDVAEQEVQAAINAAQTYLPSDLPAPPIYSKSNPADAPILTLALTSKTIPLSQVEDLADTRLAQKISQLSGVGLVTIVGGQKPAVRVQANPTAALRLWDEPGGLAHRPPASQRQPGQGQLRRAANLLSN